MPAQATEALLLVDHGSRAGAANESLEAMARQVADLAPGRYRCVLAAHMEIAAPTIAEGFDAAVEAGARHVVVCCYFLAPGRHSAEDVPRLAREAAARHPGLTFEVTGPLGPHPLLAALVLERAGGAAPSGGPLQPPGPRPGPGD